MKLKNLPVLEDAILAGYDDTGKIGLAFHYLACDALPLRLQVRVLDGQYRVLPHAPYSLAFLSVCCAEQLTLRYDDEWEPTDEIQCSACEEEQVWAPTEEKLSVMGSQRAYSLDLLAQAFQKVAHMNPLDASLAAADTLLEIETLHEIYLGPDWAKDAAKQVLGITHRMEIRKKDGVWETKVVSV